MSHKRFKAKTLLFSTQYPPHGSGVPNFYYQITKCFPHDEIVMLTAAKNGAEIVDRGLDFPVYRTGLLTGYMATHKSYFSMANLPIFILLTRIVLKEGVNNIIMGHPGIVFLAMCYIIKLIFKKNYVVFLHGDTDSPRIKLKSDRARRFLYDKAKAFIVNSGFTKRRLQEKFAVPDKNIFVLYPSVDTKKFYPDRTSDVKKRLFLSDKKILLTVGKLDKRKGHDMVIRALPAIIREIPDIVYLIAGKGNERDALDVLVKRLGVDKNVRFLGYVSGKDLPGLYNICDVFIMINRELEDGDAEGFGMVFLEANACGKPVIGGRSGGAVEAIRDGVTGFLTNPYDSSDIARKALYLLKENGMAGQLGKNGLKRVLEKFELDKNLKTNVDKLRKTLLDQGA